MGKFSEIKLSATPPRHTAGRISPFLPLFSFSFFFSPPPRPSTLTTAHASPVRYPCSPAVQLPCVAHGLRLWSFWDPRPAPARRAPLGAPGWPGQGGLAVGVIAWGSPRSPAQLLWFTVHQELPLKPVDSLSLLSSLMFINAVKKLCTGVLLCCLGLTHMSAAYCEFVPVPSGLALSPLAHRPWRGGRSSCPTACAPHAHRETELQLQRNEALLV